MTERQEFEPTAEKAVADFEGYRKVVDALSPAFRRVGILDEAGYDRALRDPRTVRLAIGRLELPFLTPIEYVAGYDAERSCRLSGQQEVSVMTVPLAALGGPEVEVLNEDSAFSAGTSAIIVETDHEETADIQQVLPEALAGLGAFEAGQFRDQRIRNPEQQPAMMALYEARFVAVGEDGSYIQPTGKDFFEAYDDLVAAAHPLTQHTHLLHVEQLRDNEALVDALWELCSDRFDWLGEAHPVSMEDTKDFFIQMVLNDDTHTIVRYDDQGAPACLGFFMSNLDECWWIKSDYQQQLEEETEAKGEQMVYFYGIAGKTQDAAAHYGRDVMQFLAQLVHGCGGRQRLLFESTNMSSRYIPRMVSQYVGQGAGLEMTEPVTKMAQIDYWYLSPKRSTAR